MSDAGLRSLASDVVAGARQLDPACAEAIAALRKRCPEAFVNGTLKPGEAGTPLVVPSENSSALIRAAFADAANGGVGQQSDAVVWRDGQDELIVFASGIRVILRTGLVLVGVPVYCDQTGRAEVTIVFAVGGSDAPTGLVMATETTPRGPDVIVSRWGDQLTAVGYDALLRVAAGVTSAIGADVMDEPLIPAALEAGPDGLRITPQARYRIGRRLR